MRNISKASAVSLALALLAVPAWSGVAAQDVDSITVVGPAPSDLTGMTEGPKIEGVITARKGETIQVTTADGTRMPILVSTATEIKSSGGLLGLDRTRLGSESLLNGLPVTVRTVEWGGGLVASDVRFKSRNLATANMIRNGTDQRFGEHDVAIAENEAATEALRGRVGDIDQYNVKGTTNVYFDTGQSALSADDQQQICAAAAQAERMNNALLLVVGYTDAVGDEDRRPGAFGSGDLDRLALARGDDAFDLGSLGHSGQI